MAVKAEDMEQTWEDVAGLHPDEMRQWCAEHIYELPYLIAYLAGRAGIKFDENTLNTQELPACRFCGQVASYRGKTKDSEVWFDMCEGCFAVRGQGIGPGIGYRLQLVKL